MRIAYLINLYPKISHTFIRREILALERRGFEVTRIALRGWDGDVVDKLDQAERARTRYVLRDGVLPLLGSLLKICFTRPRRLLAALALAWRMSRKAERPFPIHVVYLAEACRILGWLRVLRRSTFACPLRNQPCGSSNAGRRTGWPESGASPSTGLKNSTRPQSFI